MWGMEDSALNLNVVTVHNWPLYIDNQMCTLIYWLILYTFPGPVLWDNKMFQKLWEVKKFLELFLMGIITTILDVEVSYTSIKGGNFTTHAMDWWYLSRSKTSVIKVKAWILIGMFGGTLIPKEHTVIIFEPGISVYLGCGHGLVTHFLPIFLESGPGGHYERHTELF